jgi:2-oxoglutarate ferredoxin oxidoreductase subunit delta
MKSVASVWVDDELCKSCGICLDLCPQGVFDPDTAGKPVAARLDDCSGCLFCEWHCPEFAIRVEVATAAQPAAEVCAGTAEAS